LADALWELPNLSGEDRVLHGQVDAILAAIAAAGLVLTAPDAPAQRVERTSEALTNFYSFINTLGAPDAPAGDQVTISRETARRAYSALVYLRVAKDEVQDDGELAAETELRSVIRLAAAGLVITAPDAPEQRVERTSEALTNFYSFVNTLGAPDAPAGDQVTISRTAAEAALIWTNVVSVWDEDDQAAYDEIADALADAESGPVGERGEGKL
jgi:hypothetical protein